MIILGISVKHTLFFHVLDRSESGGPSAPMDATDAPSKFLLIAAYAGVLYSFGILVHFCARQRLSQSVWILLRLPRRNDLVGNNLPLLPERDEDLYNISTGPISPDYSDTTHPVPDHQLHECKGEHPAVAQVSASTKRRTKVSTLREQPRVCSHAKQEGEADRNICQPVFESGYSAERSGCEIGEAEECEENGDEGGCFA